MNTNSPNNLSNQEILTLSKQTNIMISRFFLKTKVVESLFESPKEKIGIAQFQENMPEYAIENNIVSKETQEAYLGIYNDMLSGVPFGGDDVQLLNQHGEYRWHHADYSLVYDDNGEAVYGLITFYDNTDEREMEISAEKWRAKFSTLLSEAFLSAEINLSKDTIVKINQTHNTLHNINKTSNLEEFIKFGIWGEFDGNTFNEFYNFFNINRLLGLFHRHISNDHFDYFITAKNNSTLWLRASLTMIKHPHSEDVMAMISFIKLDSLQKDFDLLTQKAMHDSLTGILNREGIYEKANNAFSNYDPKYTTALFVIDLDNFKQINDRLGHQAGDDVLKEVAKILRNSFHKSDIVGRLGGDEFIILVSGNFTLKFLETKSMELISKVAFNLQKKYPIPVTLSIGLAYGQGRFTFEKLYRLADISLYTAKRAGKSRFHIINADTNEDQSSDGIKSQTDLMSLQSLVDYALDDNTENEIKTPYKVLLENIPGEVLVVTIGETTTITHCNDWMTQYTGFTLAEIEEMQKKDLFFFIHPEDVPLFKNTFAQMKDGLDEIVISYRVKCKPDGYKNLILNIVMTERNENEAIFYCINSSDQDETIIEQQLNLSRKKMSSLIDAIPGGLARIELSDTLEVTHFNDWIYNLSGFEKDDYDKLRNGYDLKTFADDDIPILRKALDSMRAGLSTTFNLKINIKHISGITKPVIMQGSLVSRTKEKATLYIIFIDISLFQNRVEK